MSHFTVAVFHREDQNIDDLLAPYDENLAVEPYIQFTKQEAIDYARKNLKSAEGMSDLECWQMMAEDHKTDWEGNIYSTYNPRSKWDWYAVGGRWGCMLNAGGSCSDSARVGDIDFSPDEDKYEEALHFWDTVVDHKTAEDGEHPISFFNEQYYRDYYGDRETYARYTAQFSTFAVVTPDGEWHEKGKMGWFACSSETPEEARDWEEHYRERFIDTADPDLILTIVDCHI